MKTQPNYEALLNQTIAATKAEITRLQGIVAALEGKGGNHVVKTKAKGKARSTKKRATADLNATAHEMLKFVQAHGKEGVSGRVLNQKFGKVIPTIKQFVGSRTGEKIKTTGKRSAMLYFAE